jgi:hypothetical protein
VTIKFTLSDACLALAEGEAQRRQSFNESKKLKGRNNAPAYGDKALEMHRLGCIGEVAIASFLDLKSHLFKSKAPVAGSEDLPGKLEIKTRSKYNYDLLIQLNDDPSKLFVLVTYEKNVDNKTVMIVGWTYGANVMKKELIREFVRGRPCYAVPQSMLNPPETLKEETQSPRDFFLESKEGEMWLTTQGEDVVLNFSKDVLELLGWNPGDVLIWNVDKQSNCCYLRKLNDGQG